LWTLGPGACGENRTVRDVIFWFFAIAFGVSLALKLAGAARDVVRRLTASDKRYERLLRRTPSRPIAEATDGELVRIVGKVALVEQPVVGELTGKPAACTALEVHRALGEQRVLRDVRCAPFWLEDPTGRVLVQAGSAHCALEVDTTLFSGGIDDPRPSAAMKALLARRGLAATDLVRLRYTEANLQVGQLVCVYGLARREADPDDAGYRGGATRLLLTRAPEGGVLLVSNAPRALAE